MRRRDALWIMGALGVAVAIPPVLRRIPTSFTFEPIAGFDGFRRVQGGAVSGGVDPFFGLGARLPDQEALPLEMSKDPCLSLFGPLGWDENTVPVAIFSDFNCPYCKDLERRLIALRDGGAPIRLVWHEMPLLGQSSYRSARAVLAARFLGREDAARQYLQNTPLRPGPTALAAMADHLQVPDDMLLREFDGARVSAALTESLSLGQRLGIPGTPGTVIGRTLVIGAIKDADIKALIDLERATPQTACG